MVALSTQLAALKKGGLQLFQPGQRKLFVELEQARTQRQQVKQAPQTRRVLQQAQSFLAESTQIPQTGYTFYRAFRRTGERDSYQDPYFLKRAQLSAGALLLFFGEVERKDMVQDYIWSMCEESTWVLPAHENRIIDLFSAETSFLLAETLLLLGDTLDEEVRHRVRTEIERRVFDPYLRFHQLHDWYMRSNNWNGVCNGSIAATFLLLEEEPGRVKRALEIALTSLDAFLDTAFEDDGSSSEGVSYWQYGLINLVALAEYLSTLSNGAIDLLATEKMQRIATFPLKLQLSGSNFASFADCDERVYFHPGIIARLAKRLGKNELLTLLASPAELESDWRLPMMLRDILWWNGQRPVATPPTNTSLPTGGTARLVVSKAPEPPLVLTVKAGHNNEEHNHNDIGSFLLHVAGENILTDPGRGLYSRDYFNAKRYNNIFATSYAHSVPRIDGMLQGTGAAFAGRLVEVPAEGTIKEPGPVVLEFAAAYPCPDLRSARRELRLSTEDESIGTLWLHDTFVFGEETHEVEEALITWLDCTVDGPTARIIGQFTETTLTIMQGSEAGFQLEYLEEQSKANHKLGILKRLSVTLARGNVIDFAMRVNVRKM
jgi:Heparinase II/III-like protein